MTEDKDSVMFGRTERMWKQDPLLSDKRSEGGPVIVTSAASFHN